MLGLCSSAGARTAARRPLLRLAPQLASAAAAAGYATAVRSPPPVKVAKLANGLNAVAADDGTDACVVSLAFPAGSRHEKLHELGLAHHFKNWAFQGSRSSTALATAREAEIRGAVLSASLTREHLFLTAECLRKDLAYFVEVLREAAYGSKFNVYEGGAVGYLVSLETNRALHDPETVVNESLHKVAFRNGLGNSLFAAPQTKLDLSAVKGFGMRQSGSSGKVALVASGVDASELERLARELLSPAQVKLVQSSEATQASRYYGGECRVDAPSDETGYLAIGYPSGAFGSAADCAARVLKAYLGGWTLTCYSTAATPLGKVAAATGACFQPFAYSYSDAGLFGVRIQSAYDDAQPAASAVVSEIKKAAEGIPEAEFARSVATAKVAILSALEKRVSLVECLGAQILAKGKIVSPAELISKFDTMKAADVSKLAATMIKSKPSVVAYGNTMALPYADSL